MPDFRIDDTAPEHRKMRAAGLPALGLWSMAGAWSSSPTQMTDGWIPLYWVQTWPGGKKAAETLVKVGLWREEEREGLPGYQFHDWADFQRTAASWEAEKQKARERMQLVRTRRSKGDGSGERSPNGTGERSGEQKITERSTPVSNIDPTDEYGEGPSQQPEPVDNPTASDDTSSFGRTDSARAANVHDSLTLTQQNGDHLEGKRLVPARASSPPPPRCSLHLNHPKPPHCGRCAEARREREAWDTEQAAAVEAARLATARCRLCDGDGYRWDPAGMHRGPTTDRCDHQPQQRQEPA